MLDVLNQGGPVMWFLAGCALAATIIFLERLLHLHRAQIKTDDFLKGIYNVVEKGNIAEAVTICEETPGPVAYMARMAVLHYDEPDDVVQRAMEEAGLIEVPRLERNLNMLATIAKITPLAGLLGTVLGMLNIFMVMQQQAPLTHIGAMAGGMMQALLTTIAGLSIAIPAYAGYNLLIGRVESIMLDMEKSAVELMGFLARNRAQKKKKA